MTRHSEPTVLRTPWLRALVGLALGTTLIASSASAAPVSAAKPSAVPAVGPAAAVGPFSAAKPPVSISKARTHQLRPSNTVGVESVEAHEGQPLIAKQNHTFKGIPTLDISLFSDTLHAALKDQVRGYSMVLRKNGTLKANVFWDYAKSPSEGNKGWGIDTRMHVASVSKLLTAITIVDLLEEKGISVDAKIGPYIPDYWAVGTNVADITFRDLMRHSSGFGPENGDGSLTAMKRVVAKNVEANPEGNYENVNFALLRVLGAVVAGWVPADTRWDNEINDAMWDIAATQWFLSRVNSKILAPSGVAAMSAAPSGDSAYAYSGRTDTDGWNSGDVTTQLGGVGFRLSADEITKVLGTFRRGGKIVPEAVAEAAITGMLGLDKKVDTPAGPIRCKKGGWAHGGNKEQSIAYYMPGGIEVVVLINSLIGPGEGASIRLTVENAYLNSLK